MWGQHAEHHAGVVSQFSLCSCGAHGMFGDHPAKDLEIIAKREGLKGHNSLQTSFRLEAVAPSGLKLSLLFGSSRVMEMNIKTIM